MHTRDMRRDDRRMGVPRDPRDMRDLRDPRETRDPRESRDPRELGPRELADRRRPRSGSPDRYVRRSPQQYKRYRRDGDYGDRYERGPASPYRRASPPYRGGYDDRPNFREDSRGSMGRPRHNDKEKPYSFKEFMLEIDDDPSPEVAQARYQEYLAHWYGDQLKAEFEQHKTEESFRVKYDPRYFEKAIAKRNDEAKESARIFATEYAAGKVDAYKGSPEASQDGIPGSEGEKRKDADLDSGLPAFFWKPDRVATDIRLSTKLMRKLDTERGLSGNPLLPPGPEGEPKEADDMETDKKTELEEVEVNVDQTNLPEMGDKLEMQLTYLWAVHGVDYYRGMELSCYDFDKRLSGSRLVRGPCPAVVENIPPNDERMNAEFTRVSEVWEARIKNGDALEAKCARDRVEKAIDDWIESQVVMHNENK